jgi:hypothetical protein
MWWRKLRRAIGLWIAGDLPTMAHCRNCGHITSTFCARHLIELREQQRAAIR